MKKEKCKDCLCIDPNYKPGCEIDPYAETPMIQPMFFDENGQYVNIYVNDTMKSSYGDTFEISCPLNGFEHEDLKKETSWTAKLVFRIMIK